MKPVTIYGIPSCDTCRKARKWLKERGLDHTFHDLRESGLEVQMLERWSSSIDWQAFLNTRSLTWRRIPEIDRANLDKSKAFMLMLENPTLVKRPVLESGKTVAVGFSADGYAELFPDGD